MNTKLGVARAGVRQEGKKRRDVISKCRPLEIEKQTVRKGAQDSDVAWTLYFRFSIASWGSVRTGECADVGVCARGSVRAGECADSLIAQPAYAIEVRREWGW